VAPNTSEASPSTALQAARQKKSNNTLPNKPTFGKQSFHLPAAYDQALRGVVLLSEDDAKGPKSAQQIINDAIGRHLDYLRKQSFVFPEAILSPNA
jgi:hypothetical protein